MVICMIPVPPTDLSRGRSFDSASQRVEVDGELFSQRVCHCDCAVARRHIPPTAFREGDFRPDHARRKITSFSARVDNVVEISFLTVRTTPSRWQNLIYSATSMNAFLSDLRSKLAFRARGGVETRMGRDSHVSQVGILIKSRLISYEIRYT